LLFFGCGRFSFQIEHDVLACAVHSYDPFAFESRSDNGGGRLEGLLPRTDPDGFDGIAGDTLV
jgi:hypothetical protein